MNIQEILKESERTNITISVTPSDLKEFAITIIEEFVKHEKNYNSPEDKGPIFMNTDDVCGLLKITKATLCRWKKSGYLVPHSSIGKKNMYLKSDVYGLFDKQSKYPNYT